MRLQHRSRLPRIAAISALLLALGSWRLSSSTSAAQNDSDWPAYGGQPAQDHYSSLSQINRDNVKQLKVAWTYSTSEEGNLETTPVIVGRVLYAFTPTLKVVALDAASGKLLWTFDSGMRDPDLSRGVTYWTNGKESRLFAGMRYRLYALNPATGEPIKTFGEGGFIDLRKDLRGDYRLQSIGLTSPGVIYKDLIIVGGRDPETHPSPPGDIRAFDVHTGALRWRFHTIPHPGEPGYETWPKDAWKTAGAANNWAGMAVDVERGIVYVPTGSAVFDFYGGDRAGDDLFANCLLALDASTGKLLWQFQGVHHDIWDRDFPAPPALITVQHDGQKIDAIAQTTKQGWLFVFDRVTGKPLFPIEERPFPASTVPGEKTSATQPVPLAPEPYTRQLLTEDILTNRTPEAHAAALENFRASLSGSQFLPSSIDKPTIVFPGMGGGAEWGGAAVDPNTGVIYINSNEVAYTVTLIKNDPAAGAGLRVYRSQCALCHGMERTGAPPAVPSLVNVHSKHSAEQIANIVHGGRGRMSSFPNLQGARLNALLEYLRTGKDSGAAGAIASDAMLPGSKIPNGPPVKPSVESVPATNPPSGARPRVYLTNCAACHGAEKQGKPPSFPSLIGVGERLTAAQVVSRIHEGKGLMPAFPAVQGQDLKALLRYLGVGEQTSNANEFEAEEKMPYSFTGYTRFVDPDGYPAITPPWGTLNAIDLNSGKYLWKLPLGDYPELAAQGMKDTGTENAGGPTVTAGGLVFIAATDFDRKIRAFNSTTGELLWQADLPYAGRATPATYLIDGKQYLVIATCGEGADSVAGSAYVAFALP